MKRPDIKTISTIVTMTIFLLLNLYALQAQNDDLLENPSFETFDANGIAEGWQPWNVPISVDSPSYERRPQYAPADTLEAPSIQSGDNAQVIYTDFYYSFNAGIFQQVADLPADSLTTFTIDAFVWSTNLDDRSVSGASADVALSVGIDPTGGTDGTSNDIIWSADIPAIYDSYNTYTIAAITGETATVFIRINVNEALRNTFVFLDEANLRIESNDGEATETVSSPFEEPLAVTEATDEVVNGEETSEPEITELPIEPIVTETPVATNTQSPTNTDIPTEVATNTEESTATDIPTREPIPTEQDLGIILATDIPTEEIATESPPATNTSIPPTETAIPTVTPVPSDTPVPPPTATSLPLPTATDIPSETPVPGVIESIDDEPIATDSQVAPATEADEIDDVDVEEENTAPTPNPFPGSIVHTVQRGDTVARLAVLYGSTTEGIIEANDLNSNGLIFVGQGLVIPVRVVAATDTPTPTPLVIIVTATPEGITPPIGGVYIVQSGDTLSGIANRFTTTVNALAQINGITNPNSINVGQQLLIPGESDEGMPQEPAPVTPTPQPTQTYTVQSGDNLYRIAVRFGVTVQDIIDLNEITTPNVIYAGQVLQIP